MSRSMVVLQTPKKVKPLSEKKYFIDRNTPVGEPVDYYEKKPYGGRKYIPYDSVLGFVEEGGVFDVHDCNMTDYRWSVITKFCEDYNLEIPDDQLFHNGSCYTTKKDPLKKHGWNLDEVDWMEEEEKC